MSDEWYKPIIRRGQLKITTEVYPPWYLRYMQILPEREQNPYQPLKEMDITNEKLQQAAMAPTDKTEELLKKLEDEKNRKIQMVLNIISGNSERMLEQIKHIKPMTSPLKYALEEQKKVQDSLKTDRERLVKSRLRRSPVKLKPTSKWRFILENKIIRMKLVAAIKTHRSDRLKMHWRRAIRNVQAVLRFTNMIAILARTTSEVFKTFKQSEDRGANMGNTGLCFDRTSYKATIAKTTLDKDTIFTLTKPEHYRTWEEAHKAAINLRFLRSFSILPPHFQDKLAMVGWYLEVPADKVIIREGHVPDSFYFVMSGKAVCVKLNGSPLYESHSPFNVIRTYEKDDIFGEDGITEASNRSFSVTAVETCVLLSLNIHDYIRIFNTSASEDENPDHIRMLSQMVFMRYFPMKTLIQEAENAITIFYFNSGSVICKRSSQSRYIYVVKTSTENASMAMSLENGMEVDHFSLLDSIDMDTESESQQSFISSKNENMSCNDFFPARPIDGSTVKKEVKLPPLRTPTSTATKQHSLNKSDNKGAHTAQPGKLSEQRIRTHTLIHSAQMKACKIAPLSIETTNKILASGRTSLDRNLSREKAADPLGKRPGAEKRDLGGKSPLLPRKVIHFKTEGIPSIQTSLPIGVPKMDDSSVLSADSSPSPASSLFSVSSSSQTFDCKAGSDGLMTQSNTRDSSPDPSSAFENWLKGNKNISALSQIRDLSRTNSSASPTRVNSIFSDMTQEELSDITDKDARQTLKTMKMYMSKWRMSMTPNHGGLDKFASKDYKESLQRAGSVEKILVTVGKSKQVKPEKHWVKLKTLMEGDVFGIEDLDLGDKLEHQPVDVSVVSDGAEVIMIDKEYFMDNMSAMMLAHLRNCSYILPDAESVRFELEKQQFWKKYREKIVSGVYKELGIKR